MPDLSKVASDELKRELKRRSGPSGRPRAIEHDPKARVCRCRPCRVIKGDVPKPLLLRLFAAYPKLAEEIRRLRRPPGPDLRHHDPQAKPCGCGPCRIRDNNYLVGLVEKAYERKEAAQLKARLG